jgi:DNA repair exonuclease SbcCD ATPase subunit
VSSSSPIKKEHRITLETMSSTASLLTTPVTNRKRTLLLALSQQAMLESWDTTLRERRAELDDKTKELTAIEEDLRQKGQDLSRIIHERREELEEKSRSIDAKHVLTLQAVEDLTSRRLEEEERLETAISNLEQVMLETRRMRSPCQFSKRRKNTMRFKNCFLKVPSN